MNSRVAPLLVALALAIPPCSFAGPGAPAASEPVAPVTPDASNKVEAGRLKVTRRRLAALVRAAKAGNGDPGDATPAVARKKQPHPAREKRLLKSRLVAHPNGERKGQKIVGRRLSEAEVRGILATTRDFSGSDLSGMNLVGVDLRGVNFNRANLRLANLESADLAESDLELADLTGANLRRASMCFPRK